MPCSRSARSPSVSSARLVYSSPRSRLVRSTDASWSSKIALESYSSRPIRVLLPSSTEPAVASRRMSMACSLPGKGRRTPWPSLEVTLPLAVFHGRLAGPVVRAGLAALGDPGDRDLGNHVGDRRRGGFHRPGDRHVPHGAVADGGLEDRLLVAPGGELVVGEQDPVPLEDPALVGEVDRRDV